MKEVDTNNLKIFLIKNIESYFFKDWVKLCEGNTEV